MLDAVYLASRGSSFVTVPLFFPPTFRRCKDDSIRRFEFINIENVFPLADLLNTEGTVPVPFRTYRNDGHSVILVPFHPNFISHGPGKIVNSYLLQETSPDAPARQKSSPRGSGTGTTSRAKSPPKKRKSKGAEGSGGRTAGARKDTPKKSEKTGGGRPSAPLTSDSDEESSLPLSMVRSFLVPLDVQLPTAKQPALGIVSFLEYSEFLHGDHRYMFS